MSSFLPFVVVAILLAVLTDVHAQNEDFAFEVSGGDFQLEFDERIRGGGGGNAKTLWGNEEIPAYVGKAFHLAVPKDAFPKDVKSYEAKTIDGRPLPMWLLFDKRDGIFWGVPLSDDVGLLHIVLKSIGGVKPIAEHVKVNVLGKTTANPNSNSGGTTINDDDDQCPKSEDITVLTLLIDRKARAIKSKQRVIAVNNLAKFFGLPYSAFTLKPQLVPDDITDSSVVLAGPGNLLQRSSKSTTLLQVPVGCDGRLWMRTTSLIHQLKQQARDGTISEVIQLPVIGWRVKTETRPVLMRTKRSDAAATDDIAAGSGDYDGDYEDDYYEDYDEEEEGGKTTPKGVLKPPSSPPPTSTTRIVSSTEATGQVDSQTHPHRHHHGEAKQEIEYDDDLESPDFTVEEDQHRQTTKKDETTPMLPEVTQGSTTKSTTTTSSTSTTSTTTTTTTPKPFTITESKTTTTTTIKPLSPPEDDYVYEYEDEDYDNSDNDDEGPTESKTIVPDVAGSTKKTTILTETATTPKEVLLETTDFITTTIEPPQTTIPEDTELTELTTFMTEPPIIVTTTLTSTTSTTPRTSTSTTTLPTTTTTTSTTTSTPIITTTAQNIPTLPFIPITTTTEVDEDDEELSSTTMKSSTTVRHVMLSSTTTPRYTMSTIDDDEEPTEKAIKYGSDNFQPYIENRIQQMSVIAGKIFRFVVPVNTFKDFEDGYDLTIEFLNAKEEVLGKNSWCHYNPARREIYGLPLQEDVSKWEYVLKATDRDGKSVTDRLIIQVQQHKAQRAVNHEFSLLISIEKRQEFPHFVDWCLKTLRGLGRIYNTNMSEITVRNVNYSSEPVVFTWTNDSLPTNVCPKDQIKNLFTILTANDRGDPSRELNVALAPELRVKKVVKHLLGICENDEDKSPTSPITPPTNFPPFLRNPVDHINATVGELLVFKVPDDTFYDPEDVDSRNLNISLLTLDRQSIPPHNWLQFDSKNREFYGIPRKAGRSEYQLICVDNAGSAATDSLELVVYPAAKVNYNVEFSMTIHVPYREFINSASMQRKLAENLKEIFGDPDTSNIHFAPFKQDNQTLIVNWYNKSLSTVKCPRAEINRLESIINQDHLVSSRVHSIMSREFPVAKMSMPLSGNCVKQSQSPKNPNSNNNRHVPVPPVDDDHGTPEASSDEYLITFIVPAIIISVMLFLALIAACVLYRRRRTGKMNVEEDGRQSYGNKGVPVIFQEELEEKPEAGTKAPVILKDEKPPLAPPEYSKSGSLKLTDDTAEPYQPPPPFTRSTQDNGRQPRPKPTPTYRKPPPYVPP